MQNTANFNLLKRIKMLLDIIWYGVIVLVILMFIYEIRLATSGSDVANLGTSPHLIWNLLGSTVIWIILWVAYYQLRMIFKSIAEKEAVFELDQVQRIRMMGYLFMIYPVVAYVITLIQYSISFKGMEDVPFQGAWLLTALGEAEWSFLIIGFLIIALGEVFRYGVILRKENALMI